MRKSLTLSLTWLLTGGLFLVTIENIWLDPWLRNRFPDFPSLTQIRKGYGKDVRRESIE